MATIAVSPEHDTVACELFIAAPPARVFDAIADPKQTARWWGQAGVHRIAEWKVDLRVGGKWSSQGELADGGSFRVEGEYLEIDPPRVLAYTWNCSTAAGPTKTVVRWELEAQSVHGLHPGGPQRAGTGTRVRIHHAGFAGNSAAAGAHSEGWKHVMEWLLAYIENGETIDRRGAA